MKRLFTSVVVTVCALSALQSARAQGLIWQLPKDPKDVNFTVEYKGTYKLYAPTVDKKDFVPETEAYKWTRFITIRSLKQEKGYYLGKEVPCRWLEISVKTGTEDKNLNPAVDPGKAGQRVYKVLVPESRIFGKPKDENNIFVSLLPVATTADGKPRGYRLIGGLSKEKEADGTVTPKIIGSPEALTVPAVQIYPMISLLQHYRNLTEQPDDAEMVSVGRRRAPAPNFTPETISGDQFTKYTASRKVESRTTRSLNSAVIYQSDRIPTGLLKWTVTIINMKKDTGQTTSEFTNASKIVCDMKVTQISYGDAAAEIVDF